MGAVEPTDGSVRTYGNWRKPMSAGLGSLGMIGTFMLLAGLIVVILTVAIFGVIPAVIIAALISFALLTLLLRDRHGKTMLQRVAMRVGWRRSKAAGTHLYRSGPLGRTAWGTFQLPGLAAPSKLSEGMDSYGRPFALLHVPATAHYTVIFATDPDGASLVDQEQIDVWVAHWGEWLATLGDEPGVVAVSVTVETAPDSGARLQREVLGQMDPNSPPAAQAMLREVIDTYPEGSATIKAWVALTFSATTRAGGKRRDSDEMARDLASRLPALGQRLTSTGAGAARPLTAQQLCEVVRVAYDPPAARLFDNAHNEGDVPALTWEDAGPSATQAAWDHYRHDGAVSVSWSMTMAPRGEVQSSVLFQLLAPHHDIARKRVTLLYRPMDSATAARVVEQDKRVADFRASSNDRPSARVLREQRAAHSTAKEEARGAGLVNFGLLVTATVNGVDELPDAEAAIDNLAATARIQLRPVYGSQDSAFVAALPLGLVVSKHLKVPAEIRAAM